MNERSSRRALLAATGGVLALAGCLGDEAEPNEESTTEQPVDDWQETTLEDVTTDETFSIAELDRPVVIHTFATFCPTCNSHQDGVSEEYDDVRDEIVFLDLAIEGANDADDVRAHAEDNGHDWRFALAADSFTSALIEEFGQSVAVHAQSPLIVVCPDGETDTLEKPATVGEIERTVESTCER